MKLPFEEFNREILTKSDVGSKQKYGTVAEERSIEELLQSSVICINKPAGPTSHQVADYVKKILKAEKVGHGGTLEQ